MCFLSADLIQSDSYEQYPCKYIGELVVNGADMAGQDICVVCHVTAMIWSQLRYVTFFYISLE